MKTCPTCNAKFEDEFFYCLSDGTHLRSEEEFSSVQPFEAPSSYMEPNLGGFKAYPSETSGSSIRSFGGLDKLKPSRPLDRIKQFFSRITGSGD